MYIILNILLIAVGLNSYLHARTKTKTDLKKIVLNTEAEYNLPVHLLDAIIQQESSYRVNVINKKGNKGVAETSYGLGQLTYDTAFFHCGIKTIRQIMHPIKNIRCSAKVIKYQLNRYRGHIKRAVAAYQWGTPCECDGKVFKQKLKHKTRICIKGNSRTPLRCNVLGLLWNHDYVDSVLEKMKVTYLKKIQCIYNPLPCVSKTTKYTLVYYKTPLI